MEYYGATIRNSDPFDFFRFNVPSQSWSDSVFRNLEQAETKSYNTKKTGPDIRFGYYFIHDHS